MTLLTKEAIKWATAIKWETFSSYEQFVCYFRHVFVHATEGMEVSERLLSIQQRDREDSDFALEFRILAKVCS